MSNPHGRIPTPVRARRATPPPRRRRRRARRRLADVVGGLAAADWDRPTLCAGWNVRHAVAHVTMGFRYSRPQVLAGLVKTKGDFNRFADTVARRDGDTLTPQQLQALVRDNAEHPYRPPGGGFDGALTDLVMHSLDIARPLGVADPVVADAYPLVLDRLVSPRSLRFFGVDIDGIGLRATDVDWRHGTEGREITALADELVLALGRRPVDLVLDAERAA